MDVHDRLLMLIAAAAPVEGGGLTLVSALSELDLHLKQVWLSRRSCCLCGLPREEVRDRIWFYSG